MRLDSSFGGWACVEYRGELDEAVALGASIQGAILSGK